MRTEDYVVYYANKLQSVKRVKRILDVGIFLVASEGFLFYALFQDLEALAQVLIVSLVGTMSSHLLEQFVPTLEQFHASAEQDLAFDVLMNTKTEEDREQAYQIYLEKRKRHDAFISKNRSMDGFYRKEEDDEYEESVAS